MKVFFQIKMLSNSDMMLPHCISRLLDLARIVAYMLHHNGFEIF